jgi:predicted DNA-binding transcriptional regulator AlpA
VAAEPTVRLVRRDSTPPDRDNEPLATEAAGRKARAAAVLTASVEPLLVDTDQAAAACGIGRATWYRLRSVGKTPAPVRLAGRVLYRVADLKLWVSLGCPSRKEFEARKAAANSTGRK